MKTIFELNGRDPQVSITARAHESDHREPPRWRGAHVEIVIVDTPFPNVDSPTKSYGDTIRIEGDLYPVRYALKRALQQLERLDEDLREKINKQIECAGKCQACQMWFNVFDGHTDWHPDGSGQKCFGSSEIVLGHRDVYLLVKGQDPRQVSTAELKAGDIFQLMGRLQHNGQHTALRDGTEEGILIRRW